MMLVQGLYTKAPDPFDVALFIVGSWGVQAAQMCQSTRVSELCFLKSQRKHASGAASETCHDGQQAGQQAGTSGEHSVLARVTEKASRRGLHLDTVLFRAGHVQQALHGRRP